MTSSTYLASGAWQENDLLIDYRAEWLTDVLVERATWHQTAPEKWIEGALERCKIAAPGYVWARFWFRREGWLVEKYFDENAESLGYYSPVCGEIEEQSRALSTELFGLALWMDTTGTVVVLGEETFDRYIEDGEVTPVALEQAEHRIRELTTLTAQKRFPPPFVRNFKLAVE